MHLADVRSVTVAILLPLLPAWQRTVSMHAGQAVMQLQGQASAINIHDVQNPLQDNQHGERLECSHYRRREAHKSTNREKPAKASSCQSDDPLSIVIYCHCNSGSRRDAEEALSCLLPAGITVFCFDFAVGCF